MMSDYQEALFTAIQKPNFYPHSVTSVQRIDTHISTLFLTGKFVYKLKKHVNFGFLDFSTLQQRKFFCEEELRLNRRTAPNLYLNVVALYQAKERDYGFNGKPEEIIEYAVKMRQFDSQLQLDLLLNRNEVRVEQINELAHQIAQFHSNAKIADIDSKWGKPNTLLEPCQENSEAIKNSLNKHELIERLDDWMTTKWKQLQPSFKQRKKSGKVRECHGDMHLANIAIIDSKITLFDCIEFSDKLRWIDVASDLAFLLMDLESHQKYHFSSRLLNQYLSITGDYKMLPLINFYKVYRALVRAKVSILQKQKEPCIQYMELAQTYTQKERATLYITFGLSGSGKTWGSQKLADQYGLIHIRSDVERKRLAGMQATEQNHSSFEKGLYSTEMSRKTYQHLENISSELLDNNISLIVDATFLKISERQRFAKLAKQKNVDYQILHFSAETKQLEENIKARKQRGTDASDANIAILHQQIKNHDRLLNNEPAIEIPFGQELTLKSKI